MVLQDVFVVLLLVWLVCFSGFDCLMLYIVACLFIALAVGVMCLFLGLICCACVLVMCFVYYVVYFGIIVWLGCLSLAGCG